VIDNNKIHLLDANLRPVPIGVPGELYIEGVNLATGYINQPELTAERFVPNPFAEADDKVTRGQGDTVTRGQGDTETDHPFTPSPLHPVTLSPGHPAMSSSPTPSL